MEGPDERYQIATCAFHFILNESPNEAAYNTYRAGVMEIYFFSHSMEASVFYLSDDNQ